MPSSRIDYNYCKYEKAYEMKSPKAQDPKQYDVQSPSLTKPDSRPKTFVPDSKRQPLAKKPVKKLPARDICGYPWWLEYDMYLCKILK